MRFILLICLTAFVATAPVFAHPEKAAPATGVEIGTLFGLSHFPSRELTIIGIPDPLVFSLTFATPSLYVLWFPSERLALGSEFNFGVGLGYQWRVGPAFVLRTEGRYRMWFLDEEFPLIADGTNEFSLFIGLGTRLGGR